MNRQLTPVTHPSGTQVARVAVMPWTVMVIPSRFPRWTQWFLTLVNTFLAMCIGLFPLRLMLRGVMTLMRLPRAVMMVTKLRTRCLGTIAGDPSLWLTTQWTGRAAAVPTLCSWLVDAWTNSRPRTSGL